MTNSTPNGNGRTCADPCKPNVFACPETAKNTPPTCSMLPTRIEMTRNDDPRQIELTVTDQDYGDTVQVTGFRTVNGSQINSCVKLTALGGGDVLNLTVKTGSNDPANISQVTTLLADPRGLHGVFENVGGVSKCEGKLELEIRDIDSDGAEGPDVSDTVKCSIDISVRNEAPRLTNVIIKDEDRLTGISGIPEPGDLFDGRAKLYVGSPLTRTPEQEVRASVCNAALNNEATPIICKPGDEIFSAAYSRKRNPFIFEFTVSDANGRGDIMQAGLWIQQISHNANTATLPTASGGERNSIQAMYSEKENMQVAQESGRWNFISRACIGTACGPREMQSSSKLRFSALGYITSLGEKVSNNGNVKQGETAWASSKEWQKKGFPDCLDTTVGCKNANVPTVAQSNAPVAGGITNWANYEWAVATDETHLLCYKSNSQVPAVIDQPAGDICPANCAACAKRMGVTAINDNSLRFSFKIYLNDRDAGDGLVDGNYAVFVSALDKVSATLNNVMNKGNDDGWTRFTKAGAACTGATCPAGEDFTLVYDSTPPDVVVSVTAGSGGETVTTTTKATDTVSTVAGITNRYVGLRMTIDGIPEEEVTWAQKMDGTPFDGANDHVVISPSTATTTVNINAKGLLPNSMVAAGACAYDLAGNMKCATSPETFTFKASWLKTSYGDVYSKRGASLTLPTDDATTTDATKLLSDPFAEQVYTFATGVYLSGSDNESRLLGGHSGSPTQPLGFRGNYRTTDPINRFNLFKYDPSMPGNEYARLKSTATLNCDLLNSGSTSGKLCNNSVSEDLNTEDFTIVTLNTGKDWSDQILECRKANVVFVNQGTLKLGAVTSTVNGACLFVVSGNASLVIADKSAQGKIGGKLQADRFEAAVISDGGNVTVDKSVKGPSGADYLKWTGFFYSTTKAPQFLRGLAQADISQYPSEWLLYDATLLDAFRPLLGLAKTADLTCGTSTHVLCK